ncbi:unnamed protein product [Calypogeia fissa]
MESKERLFTSEGKDELLFPGVPNEVTLYSIFPKLSWRMFHTLSSVTRAWKHAIQSHQVYEARVRSQSTETLVLFNSMMLSEDIHPISLYSKRENDFYTLPPIPDVPSDYPKSCQCISLDGKVYVLGGAVESQGECRCSRCSESQGSADVYMLDIAGARKWKRCASMLEPRINFGCGVLDGKIYVFGGSSSHDPAAGSEVYDPEIDVWFPIKCIPSLRTYHQVAAIGGELFVHGGSTHEMFEIAGNGEEPEGVEPEVTTGYAVRSGMCLEVYNPVTDEWRQIEHFKKTEIDGVFLFGGKLHLIDQLGIYVYDMNNNQWTLLQSCSFAAIGLDGILAVSPLAIVSVDDELVVRIYWFHRGNGSGGSCLVQSKGFGSEGLVVLWDEVDSNFMMENLSEANCILSPVQL